MVSSLTKPDALLKPFANQGDKNSIPVNATGTQSASLNEGFPPITSVPVSQGGIPPERKDFNGLGYLLSNLYFYLQNGGQFTFDKDVSDAIGGYPQGAILNYTDTAGQSYRVRSVIPNNTYNFNVDPSYIDGEKWTKALKDEQPGAGNIGDIKYTLIKDTAPFGGAWCDGSTYTSSDFPDTYSLLEQGRLTSVSFTEYQNQITANGVCGFFGFDAASMSFKVPTIKNVYIKAAELGSGGFESESLPNISGTFGHTSQRNTGRSKFNTVTGAFFGTSSSQGVGYATDTHNEDGNYLVNFNASRSSSTYKNKAKVNPDHIFLKPYVVLYIGVQDANEATWVLKEDVSNKVNNLGSPSTKTYPTTQAVSDAITQLRNSVYSKSEVYTRTEANNTFDLKPTVLKPSKNNSGYIRYNDGTNNPVKLCWGIMTSTGTITLPVAYTTTTYRCFSCAYSNANAWPSDPTKTNFRNNGVGCTWFTMGY